MYNPPATGPYVLLIEDEHIVADALARGLRACGATIIGPAPTVATALMLLMTSPRVDGALLDVNLRGIRAYDVADDLIARGVPFVFATGYETSMIPARYRDIAVLQKPFDAEEALAALFPRAADRTKT
jgi:CheY-like chemotaxis protein